MESYVRESDHHRDIAYIHDRTNMLENRIENINHTITDYRTNTSYYRDMIDHLTFQLAEMDRRIKAMEERTGMNMAMPTAEDVTTFLRGDN